MAGICAVVILGVAQLQLQQYRGTFLPEQFGETEMPWIFAMPFYLYSFFLIQLPMAYLAFRLLTAKGKSDWRFASMIVKIVMVVGVSYLFLYGHGMHRIIEENL